MTLSVGDVVRGGGKVVRIIPAESFTTKWRQQERIKDVTYRAIFDLLKRHSEDVAALEDAGWEEVAKLAGYESLQMAHAANKSYTIDHGLMAIVEIEQAT